MNCSKHLDVQASGACTHCGKLFCAECLIDIDGKMVCKDHVHDVFQEMKSQKASIDKPKKSPPKPAKKKKLPVVLSVIFAFIVIVAVFGEKEEDAAPVSAPAQNSNSSSSQSEQAEPVVETVKITAKELMDAYNENGVKADNEYKGKILEVTGIVDTIDKDILDTVYVTIGTGAQFEWNVQCYFKDEGEIAKAAELSPGEEVTIIGECDGKAILNVDLKNSRLG